jgi:hypothetical protein
VIGLAHQLQERGLVLSYGKPLGNCLEGCNQDALADPDVQFMVETLQLSDGQVRPCLVFLEPETLNRRLQGKDQTQYQEALLKYQQSGTDLLLLEGPGSLAEGRIFDLTLQQMADKLNAQVLLVSGCQTSAWVDRLVAAKDELGDRLMGVVVNTIDEHDLTHIKEIAIPYLTSQAIRVLGLLPRNALLHSVSVGELVHHLKADVLCCGDRLDLWVETFKIGAMNVNAAMEYLRTGRNMAVVTGGDRTDIQLAALESSTQCLILTGHPTSDPRILSRAEELEVPILSVDLDTLTTVEIIHAAFSQTRLQGTAKVNCVRQLVAQYVDIKTLLACLDLAPSSSV